MSPQKLLELALLDASGVLDHEESAEFEHAFDRADDDLKAQVRREQARFADVSEILPDVTPRPELRSRVLESVREASGKHRDAVGQAVLSHAAQERETEPRHQRRRGGIAWRVSTFAFATAFVAMSAMTIQLNQEFTDVSDNIARNERIDTLLRSSEQAGFLSAILDDSYQRSPLLTADDDAQGSIFLNTETGRGFLAFRKLTPLASGSRYVLVALGDDEIASEPVARFASAGETNIIEFDFDPALGTSFALAIESAEGLEIVYRTA